MEPLHLTARPLVCRLLMPHELREDDGGLMRRHIDALDRAARRELDAAVRRLFDPTDEDGNGRE